MGDVLALESSEKGTGLGEIGKAKLAYTIRKGGGGAIVVGRMD